MAVAFFGDAGSREYSEEWIALANSPSLSEKFAYFHLNDEACAKSYGASAQPAVVLFRTFDESPIVYSGTISNSAVSEWMTGASVPTLIDFSDDYIEPIFGKRNPAVFLFRSKEDSDADFAKTFSEAATKMKGKILFVVSGIKDGIQHRLAEFIGVEDSMLPTIRILNPAKNMAKFTYEGDVKGLKIEELETFIDNFKADKLTPFLKSAEPPADNSEPVKVIVGKTFKSMVLDSGDDVLVKFYAPWCGHCKKLAPVWEEVAKELADVKGLVIAKFDSTANEAEGVEVRGYPTLKFYTGGQVKSYDGDRGKDDIINWLKENSSAYKKHLESKAEL